MVLVANLLSTEAKKYMYNNYCVKHNYNIIGRGFSHAKQSITCLCYVTDCNFGLSECHGSHDNLICKSPLQNISTLIIELALFVPNIMTRNCLTLNNFMDCAWSMYNVTVYIMH